MSPSAPGTDTAAAFEFAIGWFPYWAPDFSDFSDKDVTLRRRLPTLLPALLYGDAVTVICPESDDVMEMHDYGDVYRAANGGATEYLGERSRFQIMSVEAAYPSEDDPGGRAAMEPLVPDVQPLVPDVRGRTCREARRGRAIHSRDK
jgi:hypothetical protein